MYVCQVKKVSFVECINTAQSELEHARTVNSLPHLNIAALAGGGVEGVVGGGGVAVGGGGLDEGWATACLGDVASIC